MKLNVNQSWVTFNTYTEESTGTTGQKLLPDMSKPGDRCLAADPRDFVTVAARS